MKKIIFPIILVLTVIVLVFIGGFFWWEQNSKAVTSVDTKIRFVIPKGWSATQIGNSLHDKDLIRNPLAFKFFVQLTGKTRDLKPGEFTLSSNMILVEIIDKLMKGPDEFWVTVPEGLRREEVVGIFISDLEMDDPSAVAFSKEFLTMSEEREGFLFPETYLFPKDINASAVVKKMLDTFNDKIEGATREGIDNSSYGINQIITMASIIEREARVDAERPVVAGILWKRLETAGWLMQADASVQYAVANAKCKTSLRQDFGEANCNWWPILTKENLELDSPYNLYKYKPIPPSPIANPGLLSIKAATFPKDSSYWFYIHDLEGMIRYATTLAEHNANVRKYLGK